MRGVEDKAFKLPMLTFFSLLFGHLATSMGFAAREREIEAQQRRRSLDVCSTSHQQLV